MSKNLSQAPLEVLESKRDSLHRHLLAWYHTQGRKELPWRNYPRDGSHAYAIYVSEVMLQQTRLSRVLESYYQPFLARFPSLEKLAESSEEEVLYLWQGLGYYSRARYLHKSAQICCQQYDARLPHSFRALRGLPGVGDYTAGAILCFGFGQVAHFADSNIARVLQNLAGKPLAKSQLLSLAQVLLPRASEVFDYHQALIDLGALICTSSPNCARCPIASLCPRTFRAKTRPKAREHLTLHLALCSKQDSIALSPSHTKLYQGLYNLPLLKQEGKNTPPLTRFPLLGSFSHSYTKYHITAHIYRLPKLPQSLQASFYQRAALPPISNLTQKALRLLEQPPPKPSPPAKARKG